MLLLLIRCFDLFRVVSETHGFKLPYLFDIFIAFCLISLFAVIFIAIKKMDQIKINQEV